MTDSKEHPTFRRFRHPDTGTIGYIDVEQKPAMTDTRERELLAINATEPPWSISEVRTTEGQYMVVGGAGQEFGLIATFIMKSDAEIAVRLRNSAGTVGASREAIAKAIYTSWLDAGHCAENHFQWFDAGKDNPDSCVHYSNVAKALKAADAVLAAVPQLGVQTAPVAWRYKCRDGSEFLMLKRLTDEQKRRGYYTGEDREDEVEGDEAIVGPFHWAEETPLYAALSLPDTARGRAAREKKITRLATIEECAQIADNNGWEATAAQIRSLALPSAEGK